jgi:uncharacterized protein (DUF1810 family)
LPIPSCLEEKFESMPPLQQETDPHSTDPFDLARFVEAQEGSFDRALSELRRGRKQTHWMWFIFPQLAGLGSSPVAQKYAIRSLDEARAYLAHPVLRGRLLQCCHALLGICGFSALDIMGYPDHLKLGSSMTLFSLAAPEQQEFKELLRRYFGGRLDQRTLELIEKPK